jgi:U3 small nucleolar RNA-associated protein 23
VITQCSIRHLYTLETDNESLTAADKSSLIDLAKTYERRHCNHHELPEPLSTLECLSSVVDPKGSHTNKNHYVVASQDSEVRAHMREILGVPLIYIHRSVMNMEQMAEKSGQAREREERSKFRTGLASMRGAKRKHDDRGDSEAADQVMNSSNREGDVEAAEHETHGKRRMKGLKEPNPLSVKKPKKKPLSTGNGREIQMHTSSKTTTVPSSMPAESQDATIHKASEDGSKKKRRKRKHGHQSTSGRDAAGTVADSDT